MKKIMSAATLLITSMATLTARADLLNWAPEIGFDQGVRPVLGVGTTQFGQWEIEIHQGQSGPGPLWYSSGRATGTGTPALGSAASFDWGFAPAMATINTDPNAPSVIEVHQQQAGAGPLWFSVGSMSNVWTPNTISWTPPAQYDWGVAPSVASLNGTVVEVHQAETGPGPMWYRVGSTSGSTVSWNPNPYYYDWGFAPSVAIASMPGTTPMRTYVVEVHQQGAGAGPLWFRTGQVNGDQITWSNPAIYDYGVAPKIAVYQSRVIEVHQQFDGVGQLWYHLGGITGTGLDVGTPNSGLAWDQYASPYGNGYAPAVAFDPVSIQGYEIHQRTNAMGTLMSQIFTTGPVVPLYPQLESKWCWVTSALMTIEAIRGDVKDDGRLNGASGADALECQAMNLRQSHESPYWGPNGSFIDCCANVSPNDEKDNGACDRPGDYVHTLNDYGFSHTDSSTSVDFVTLQGEIASGRPVPFGIQYNWAGTPGHALVATGTEIDSSGGQWVLVNDPGGGVQWVNPFQWFSNTSPNPPYIVTEMSINVKAP